MWKHVVCAVPQFWHSLRRPCHWNCRIERPYTAVAHLEKKIISKILLRFQHKGIKLAWMEMKHKSYIHLTTQFSQRYHVYLMCIIVQSASFERVYVCASFLTVAMSVFLYRCDKALISWKRLNICLPIRKSEWALCFALLVYAALLYLVNSLYLNLCFFSLIPFQFFSSIPIGKSKWEIWWCLTAHQCQTTALIQGGFVCLFGFSGS